MYHVKTYDTKTKCGLKVCNGLIRVKNIKYMYTLLLQINKNIVCKCIAFTLTICFCNFQT